MSKHLNLVVDMYGCPNRCKHCWLGHMPNIKMKSTDDEFIMNYFSPYFSNITYYSWLREPDFCDNYIQRWERDKQISTGPKPQRFELASFYRIVRDPLYVNFLKSVGVKKVQLTFFGLEKLTDFYVGRPNAYKELLSATQILIENGIAPRWQAFINEENKDEIVELLSIFKEIKHKTKCEGFSFFVHAGSCDGENRKLYNIRIEKQNIPCILIPYYLDYDELLTEQECYEILKDDPTYIEFHNEEEIVLNISNTFDVYFNFTHMIPIWKIGNLKTDEPKELISKIINEDSLALRLAKTITIKELVLKYSNKESQKAFFLENYKQYLFNLYLENYKEL
ncbi:MAG: radical SAM protein [Anaeroplasmataceae bacterium]|nr:radical SAM protein [Anaeroplasmataceae bacterium]